jgi:hypothetical protein
MTREVIRVEPLSTYLENWKAPTSAVTRRRALPHIASHRQWRLVRRRGDLDATR